MTKQLQVLFNEEYPQVIGRRFISFLKELPNVNFITNNITPMPASFIEHQGKKILLIDYQGLKKKEEMLETLADSMELFKGSQGKMRTLIDVTDAAGNKEWMEESKRRGREVSDRVLKSAIVGVTGIKKVLLMGYNAVTGGRVKPFDTREQALDYLASD